jgi:hypothetical protein
MKQQRREEPENRNVKEKTSEKRKSHRRKKDAGARKGREVAKHSAVSMFCASGRVDK